MLMLDTGCLPQKHSSGSSRKPKANIQPHSHRDFDYRQVVGGFLLLWKSIKPLDG